MNPRKRRFGFTIIELLVVIGIIAVLLAALIPLMSGSRDSALTAKCKNNMHALAQGVISVAQANGEYGHFPAAGMYRSIDYKSRKKKQYYPHRPWISNVGNVSMLNGTIGSIDLGAVAHFMDSDDQVRFAITNGAIWEAVNSVDVYRCPAHANAYEKANKGRKPGWSYMMNQEFGFNRNGAGSLSFFGASIKGMITVATGSDGERTKNSAARGHDKVLLLAEIQGVDVSSENLTGIVSGGGIESDAVLEYTREDMGFNHPIGKRKWGGNVAFADGHVDTIILPTKETKGISRRDLTRYLCQGYDVPHDGRAPTSLDQYK